MQLAVDEPAGTGRTPPPGHRGTDSQPRSLSRKTGPVCNDANVSSSTTQSTPSPVVVLVHGAWHGAWCWSALQAELDSRGIASLAVDLPGHGASIEPLGDLYGDAEHVAKVIDGITGPVVLVGHSYGGAVITEASTLTKEPARIAHLVYLTAFVPDVGESVIGLANTLPAATTTLASAMVIGDGDSTINPDLAHASFYGQCDPAATPANVARLCAQPFVTFTQTVRSPGWASIESTYVRCTNDEAIHISHQDVMAGRCTSVTTLETDHSPFASKPAETADIIGDIIGEIVRRTKLGLV